MSFYDTFRENIRYLRRKHGLTRKEMAGILGVCPGTVGRMERGETVRLHTGMLCRACDFFDISADAMLREMLEN